MRTDGRTDMTKLIVAFRSFANASKNHEINNNRVKIIYFTLAPHISISYGLSSGVITALSFWSINEIVSIDILAGLKFYLYL